MQRLIVPLSLVVLLAWSGLASGRLVPDRADLAPAAKEKPDTDQNAVNDWVLRMVRRGGFGPQGGKTISEFRVNRDGRFNYNGVTGQLPKKEVDALMKAVLKADKGPAAEDAGTVAFYGKTPKGEAVMLKLFMLPNEAPDCQALLKRLAELTQTYKDKKQ